MAVIKRSHSELEFHLSRRGGAILKNTDFIVSPVGGKFSEVFAFHEAGHAVVATYYGQTVSGIDLTTPIPTCTFTKSKSPDELAIMTLGGVAAQVIREWSFLSNIWKETREKLVRKRLEANVFDLKEYKKVASPDDPETFDPHASKALEILETQWETVKKVASHLQIVGKVASNEEYLSVLQQP